MVAEHSPELDTEGAAITWLAGLGLAVAGRVASAPTQQALPQAAVQAVAGIAEDQLLQVDVWADKRSTCRAAVNEIADAFGQLASVTVGAVRLVRARVVTVRWSPDASGPRYIADVQVTAAAAS